MGIFDIFRKKKDNYTRDYNYKRYPCTEDEWYEKKRENKIADVLDDEEKVEESKEWLDSHQALVGADNPTANLHKPLKQSDIVSKNAWKSLLESRTHISALYE